jgi:uncharacterized membrane protein (DUF441 family)
VLAQAAGFAVLAAISPTALLVMAVFLGSDNPRRIAGLYVIGAVVMTVIMAVTVLLVLQAAGLSQPRQHESRYGLRLGLGILALLVAAVMIVAARRPSVKDKEGKPGLIARLTASPRPLTAFLAGVILFAPSTTFIAAVQVIATANANAKLVALAMLIVIALTALTVWLPLIAYYAAPEATARTLRNANGWLAANGRVLAVIALLIAGVALTVNGALNV